MIFRVLATRYYIAPGTKEFRVLGLSFVFVVVGLGLGLGNSFFNYTLDF